MESMEILKIYNAILRKTIFENNKGNHLSRNSRLRYSINLNQHWYFNIFIIKYYFYYIALSIKLINFSIEL